MILILLYLIGLICLFLIWARVPKTRIWVYHTRLGTSSDYKLQRYRDLTSKGISPLAAVFLLLWPFYVLAILILFIWTEDDDTGATEDDSKNKSAYR